MSDWDLEVQKNRIQELEMEVLALRAELAVYRRDAGHIIDLREDGWTIQHPLSCRPNLFDCIYNFAAAETRNELIRHSRGRYHVGLDKDGWLAVGEKVG